ILRPNRVHRVDFMTHESPTRTLSTPRRSSSRPVPWPALLAAVAVPAALALATYPVRERLFTAVAGFAEGSALASAVASVADFGLLALVATAGVLAVWCWLRARRRFWLLALAVVGVITAYGVREAVNLLVEQARSCSVVDTVTVRNCSGGGDWSGPSKHAVLAAAFTTACILVVPRFAWLAVPLALAIAASRVAGGVHYVHDVLSGLALGAPVLAPVVAVAWPGLGRGPAGGRARSPSDSASRP